MCFRLRHRSEAELQSPQIGLPAGTGAYELPAAGTEPDRDSPWTDYQFYGYFCAVHYSGAVPSLAVRPCTTV